MSHPPQRSPGRRTLIVSGLGAAAVAAGLAGWQLTRPSPGEAAPAWMDAPWLDAQGRAIDLSSWKNRVVLLNFWATWCPPCVEEMPELSELHQRHERRGFGVFGIGIDSPSKIAEFQAKTPVSYPLAVGGLGATELGRAFGNQGGMLPFSVLLDRQGRIAQRILGRVKLPVLDAAVRNLLT